MMKKWVKRHGDESASISLWFLCALQHHPGLQNLAIIIHSSKIVLKKDKPPNGWYHKKSWFFFFYFKHRTQINLIRKKKTKLRPQPTLSHSNSMKTEVWSQHFQNTSTRLNSRHILNGLEATSGPHSYLSKLEPLPSCPRWLLLLIMFSKEAGTNCGKKGPQRSHLVKPSRNHLDSSIIRNNTSSHQNEANSFLEVPRNKKHHSTPEWVKSLDSRSFTFHK